MAGIGAAFSALWVLVMMASTVDARVINKRAAFYIANDTMCIVDGELYFNGDPVPTDDHCEKCTCRPPGFSCVLRDCEVKPGCKAVRKDGECCPDYICGCAHNGNVYKDGDFIRDLQNPCYTCRCHGSSISCTFADCLFRSDCGPEYIQGECCPRYDHCPPLSTTQKTTTVITTVPITYDETTKPLFNLTSPPHERLATLTTIFPTIGTMIVSGGDVHTTETYAKPDLSVVSVEATQTTRGHESTVKPSSESSTLHASHSDTTTVTTLSTTRMTSEISDDSTQKPESLIDEIVSTVSISSTDSTISKTDVITDAEEKDFTSALTAAEISSEGYSFKESQEVHDGQTTQPVTEVSHDRQTDESVTELSHDRQTGESTTELSHDRQTDESATELSYERETTEPVTEVSQFAQEDELVTDVIHDRQTTVTEERSPHDSKTDHTTHESDETASVPFSEEASKATTDITTGHEDLKISSGDEVHGTQETFSSESGAEGESESFSPSLVTTMSGDIDTEVYAANAFTATESHDVTSLETHGEVTVSETFTTEAQDTTTQKVDEPVVINDATLSVVSLPDDFQTDSEIEDKTTLSSSGHFVFGDSDSSTTESEAQSHSFSTGSIDDVNHDSTNELYTEEEEEISIQDAEEMSLLTWPVTPSDANQQSSTTIHDGISHITSSEDTHTQTLTDELHEEQSANASEETEDHLQTEKTEIISTNADDTDTDDDSLPPVHETTHTQSTRAPIFSLHAGSTSHSHERTTETSVYNTSPNFQAVPTTRSSGNSEDLEEFVASLFTEDVTEKDSDVSHSTTEHVPHHVHPLNEIVTETNVPVIFTTQSSSEDHDAPQLLSESVNISSLADESNAAGEQINADNNGSSQSSVILITADATETAITMEAETDLPLTSEDSYTKSVTDDKSITSSRGTEHSELFPVASESAPSVHTTETPKTLPSSPEISSFENHESTSEHTAEDDTSVQEQELSSEKSHTTSTEPPEQDTPVSHQNIDITVSTTKVVSDNLEHYEYGTEDSFISTSQENYEHGTFERSTSTTNDHALLATVKVPSSEESNGGDRNDVLSTAESAENRATSLKSDTDEPKGTTTYDEIENTATYATITSNLSKTEEQPQVQEESTSATEITSSDSQENIGSHIADDLSEITMDAEESFPNNGFESTNEYLHTTENVEMDVVSTTQDHASVSKDDRYIQDHYTVDGETYSAPNGEHSRTSRSTSSNSEASSITIQYPEKLETQSQHTSEIGNENTGASITTQSSVSSDSGSLVDDENKLVTERLHTEAAPISFQHNTLESTDSTYLNSEELSSLSFETSDENTATTSNTDGSYHSEISTLITNETEKLNEDDANSDIDDSEEVSKVEPKQEASLAITAEISSTAEPTSGLLKEDSIARDLIVPIEFQFHSAPFDANETEKPIVPDHSTHVTERHITNPPTTLTPAITSSAVDLESSETENKDSSENYDKNNEDLTSRFSRTSEKYTPNEANVNNEFSASATETEPTISSYTMDAEVDTAYSDDDTENTKEHVIDETVNNSPSNTELSPEQASVLESTDDQIPTDSDFSEDELVGKEFQNGPEKGGEWFEPTVPVLSAVNVHKAKDETSTSVGSLTTVKNPTSPNSEEDVTLKNEETTSPVTELVGQTEKNVDSDDAHSSAFHEEEQHDHLTTANSHVKDFTYNSKVENVDSKSTNEIPSSSTETSEATHFEETDDSGHGINATRDIYTSVLETEQQTNLPAIDDPRENDAGAVVSSKFTFVGDEESGSSSEDVNGDGSSDRSESEDNKLPILTAGNEVTHGHATETDQSVVSFDATTSEMNSVSQRDEVESVTTIAAEHREAPSNDDLRKQEESEEVNSSQDGTINSGSEITKESSISLNDRMLSDGVSNIIRFTEVMTQTTSDNEDFTTDHIGSTESLAVYEDVERGLDNAGSVVEIHSDSEQTTSDNEVSYLKESIEEKNSQESNTADVDESKQQEDSTTDDRLPVEKNSENSVTPGQQNKETQNKNDEERSTEQITTVYYRSTTPLPLLLFNEFVEKVKEDSLVDLNLQPDEEHYSTIQPEEVSEVLSELISHGDVEEDLEKQARHDTEISVNKDNEIGTTAHVTPTLAYEEKQTETYSATSRLEDFTTQHAYSTEDSNSDDNLNYSEKVTATTTISNQVTEENKPKKNVSRVFVLRISHDYPSDERRPQKKEEHPNENDAETYSVKSSEIVVDDSNDSNPEERSKVTVTTEKVVTHQNERTDDVQNGSHNSEVESTTTKRSSIESTSTVHTTVQGTAISRSSTFNSGFTEVQEDKEEEEQSKIISVDVSEPETTEDAMSSHAA